MHNATNTTALTCALFAAALAAPGVCASRDKPPAHPAMLAYPPLSWEIPTGAPYRQTLTNGLKAYIAEDHSLPLVTIVGYVRCGTVSDPPGKEQLGDLTFSLMRSGGTQRYCADTLDALIERLAINASFSLAQTQGQFKASFLSEFSDTALSILEQMLFHPAFEQARLDQQRGIAIETIRHRFDDPGPTLSAAYYKTMYPHGANSRLASEKGVAAITRDDIAAYHASVMKTENILLGVSGDFDKNTMIQRLQTMFPMTDKKARAQPFPSVEISPGLKCLVVHKPISQAYVRMGLPMFARPHPDYYPMSVLNLILGGSSFISRLGSTVRSDRGLTYSIYSDAESNYIFPATLYVQFFTKHESVHQAIALCLSEIAKLVDTGVTDEELADAKKILVDALPSMFRSADDIVDTYAWNEYYGRSDDHFVVYPGKINAITKRDIARVAHTYLDTSRFTYVVVGDTAELFAQEESGGFALKKLSPRKVITSQLVPRIGEQVQGSDEHSR